MAKVVPRDVGPFLSKVRDFLIGRKHMNNLRFPVRIYRLFSFYQSTFFKEGYTRSPADLRFQDKGFLFIWPSLTFKETVKKCLHLTFKKSIFNFKNHLKIFLFNNRGMFYVIDIFWHLLTFFLFSKILPNFWRPVWKSVIIKEQLF